MADVRDYLKWRGDLPFCRDPINRVDALVFCALSYIHFDELAVDGITLEEAAEQFLQLENMEGRIRSRLDPELLELAGKSRRFGTAKLFHYRSRLVREEDTQFAAVTFLTEDGTAFITFRGTDSTITGWKEDFNMSFQQTVPSQRLALEYTREVALLHDGPILLGGHSKGGNMAVFAGARSSPMIQEQILAVYNNDGPGFSDYMMGDPGYLAMVPKIHTFVPQSSIIGMLMDHEEPYTIIRSKQLGLLQHDVYNWEIQGPDFLPMEEITTDSRFLNLAIRNWAASLSNQQRNQIVDAFFGVLESGEDSTDAIFHPRSIVGYLKTLGADEETRKLLTGEFQNIVEIVRKTGAQFLEEREKPEKRLESGVKRRLEEGLFRKK